MQQRQRTLKLEFAASPSSKDWCPKNHIMFFGKVVCLKFMDFGWPRSYRLITKQDSFMKTLSNILSPWICIFAAGCWTTSNKSIIWHHTSNPSHVTVWHYVVCFLQCDIMLSESCYNVTLCCLFVTMWHYVVCLLQCDIMLSESCYNVTLCCLFLFWLFILCFSSVFWYS